MEAAGHSSSSSSISSGSKDSRSIRSSSDSWGEVNRSSVRVEAIVTCSNAHLTRSSSRSRDSRRGRGARVGQVTPDVGGISQTHLRLQDRQWVEYTRATGVVLSGINPRLTEGRMLFRRSAALVALSAILLGIAALLRPQTPPGAWLQHQTGFKIHGAELVWDGVGEGAQQPIGDVVGGWEPKWSGDGMGVGEPK